MSLFTSSDLRLYISSTFGAAKDVTIASNANPSLLTAVAHGLVDNDEFLFKSGWEDANYGVFRSDQQSADTLLALGLVTTNTTYFPSGQGIGTLQKISSWLEIPQIADLQPQGGDANTIEKRLLGRRNAIRVANGFNATSMNLTLGLDRNNANYQALYALTYTGSAYVAVKAVDASGSEYGYAQISMSGLAERSTSDVTVVRAQINFQGRVTAYAT